MSKGELIPDQAASHGPLRHRFVVAADVLKCALSWEPGVRLIGNVMAVEVAMLAALVLDTCPRCGSEAWVNIDCELCTACARLANGERP